MKTAGRTMDFGTAFSTKMHVIAVGTKMPPKISRPLKNALTWETKYGYISMRMWFKDKPHIFPITPGCWDGMNEHGLSVGVLWQPCSVYNKVPSDDTKRIFSINLADYILGNFKTVAEATAALPKIAVLEWISNESFDMPFHFILQDPTENKVVEYQPKENSDDGELRIFDCPNGIMCNAPFYQDALIEYTTDKENAEWNFNPHNQTNMKCGRGQEINGSGMLDVPGDATPPSRFVRATAYNSAIWNPQNKEEATNWALQLLSIMQVPRGTVLKKASDKEADYTQWSVLRDYNTEGGDSMYFYFFSQFNPTLFRIRLADVNWHKEEIIPVDQPSWCMDLPKLYKK